MSNINKDDFWENLNPTFEQTEERYFETWVKFEERFGEFGTPGFSEQTAPVKSPGLFGHDNYQDVRYTFYRGEQGELLFISGRYYDESDIRHPFVYMSHPDHQRQGLGTKMALYLEEQFIAEEGHKYGFNESEFAELPRSQRASITVPDMYQNIAASDAGAAFMNKIVDTFFTT
jgi:hypothetical protein